MFLKDIKTSKYANQSEDGKWTLEDAADSIRVDDRVKVFMAILECDYFIQNQLTPADLSFLYEGDDTEEELNVEYVIPKKSIQEMTKTYLFNVYSKISAPESTQIQYYYSNAKDWQKISYPKNQSEEW